MEDILALGRCQCLETVLGHGEHAPGAAGPVVDEVGALADLVRHGGKDEAGHELDDIPGSKVLPRLLVVLLVEAADKLLEDHAHGVVVQGLDADASLGVQDGLGAQVDLRVREFLYEGGRGCRPRASWGSGCGI